MVNVHPSFTANVIEPLRNLLSNPIYRRYIYSYLKLRRIPRYQPFSLKLGSMSLSLPDSASFLSNYRSIFCDRIFDFLSHHPAPKILDLGANIGLSVLFFKQLYPQALIVALEPDPTIFPYLEQNIYNNGYDDVILIQKAAWNQDITLPFHSSFADDGYVVHQGTNPTDVMVEAVDIRNLLSQYHFDFIKMDIEGSEKTVLPACEPYLDQVSFVFVEFHSWPDQPQGLAEIIRILESTGFRLSIQTNLSSPRPFMQTKIFPNGFDFQANIFAWRH